MMRFKWLLLICLFWAPAVLAQNPVLLFSDLTFGPNTGWNGSSTQGAAVTVWGKNFGATRGSSYITINGAQLSTSSSYAEWDAIGPARGLERITFWIPSTAATGNGNITVTVNGVTSNALPFQVAPATILFVDVTNGNNNNDGRTTATAWKDLWKWTPCLSNDPYHYPSHCNTLGDSQYIMYVRGGTYTTKDPYAGAYNPFIGAIPSEVPRRKRQSWATRARIPLLTPGAVSRAISLFNCSGLRTDMARAISRWQS